MKKKGFGLLMTLAGAATLVLGLTACDVAGGDGGESDKIVPPDHSEHVWVQQYIDDGDRHYQTCEGCNEIKYSKHDFSKGDCVCGKGNPKDEHKGHEWSNKFVDDGDDRHFETCNGCEEVRYFDHKYDANDYCICGHRKPEEAHKHTMTEHERVEPTCTAAGTVLHYTCSGCYLTFADKDGKTELNDILIPETGHAMTEHTAKDSTCTEEGNRHYYSCSRCKKNFEDSKGNNLLEEVAFPLGRHDMTYHEGQYATCTENGTLGYYTCSSCGKNYSDPQGWRELIDDDDYIDYASGHEMSEREGYIASCLDDGMLTHWYCYRCEKDYADEEGTEALETTVIPAYGHKMTVMEGLAPTCTTSGYPAYYYCSNCETNYKDEEGTETNSNPHTLTLPATGHNMTPHAQVDATCTEEGVRAYYSCSNCVRNFADEDGAQGLRDNELTIRANGHTWDDNACTVCDYDGGGSRGLQWCIAAVDENDRDRPATEYGVSGIGTCTDTELIIPDTYQGLPVTKISDRAFKDCSSVTSVEIPDSMKNIGYEAFYHCNSLTSIEIPDSVTSLGNCAFGYSNSLESVKIGRGLNTIINSMFDGCTSLTDVEIPDSVESIGSYAFVGCTSLESLEIPNSVTSIGEYAFNDCTLLNDIELPNGLTELGWRAFWNCTALSAINIPQSITEFGDEAFDGCTALASVTVEDGVTEIGWKAFNGCTSLVEIELPDSVTSIGGYAFAECTSLASVTLSEGLLSIGSYAFEKCAFTNFVVPNSVTEIGSYAFYSCKSLRMFTLGTGVESIGNSAFSSCYKLVEVYNLSSLVIERGSYEYGDIGYYALGIYDSLDVESKLVTEGDYLVYYYFGKGIYLVEYTGTETDLVLPDHLLSNNFTIHDYAFEGSQTLKSITLSRGVKAIGNGAFYNCTNLESVSMVGSVTSIGDFAFYNCKNLTSVELAENLESIGEWVFAYCTALESIFIPASVTSIGEYALRDIGTVYYMGASRDEWEQIDGWSMSGVYVNANPPQLYCYSENQPTAEGNYWHYDTDGIPTKW